MRVVFLVLVALLVLGSRDAEACGMFTRPSALGAEEAIKSTPYLAVERTLLIWDRETKEEDFIREARFERAGQGFGFVVPTPTKPDVAAVKDPPFDRLQQRMPFVPYKAPAPPKDGPGHGRLAGGGSGAKEDAEPVQVLAKQTIGSFTAFTLQASESGAFDEWLGENGFTIPEEARSWLDHYIKMKFFFVAFKYEPPKTAAATKSLTSETVRIRFKTPKPYYPYMDATHPHGMDLLRPRTLLGWTITRDRMIDIARYSKGVIKGWRRPWSYSWQTEASPADLAEVLGPELAAIAPKAEKVLVQPFRDMKPSREGYGDVVLVNLWNDETFTPADKEAHRVLLGVLDPVLVGEPGDELSRARYTLRELDRMEEEREKAKQKPAEKTAKSCSAAPGGGGGGWLFGLVAVALLRRRRLFFALGLLGCHRPADADRVAEAGSPPAADGEAPSLFRPYTMEEREERVFDVLRGRDPTGVPENKDERPKPSITIDYEATDDAGATSEKASLVLAHSNVRLRQCYDAALKADPGNPQLYSVKVLAHVALNDEGTLSRGVTVDAPDGAFKTCVVAALMRNTVSDPSNTDKKTTVRVIFTAGPPAGD